MVFPRELLTVVFVFAASPVHATSAFPAGTSTGDAVVLTADGLKVLGTRVIPTWLASEAEAGAFASLGTVFPDVEGDATGSVGFERVAESSLIPSRLYLQQKKTDLAGSDIRIPIGTFSFNCMNYDLNLTRSQIWIPIKHESVSLEFEGADRKVTLSGDMNITAELKFRLRTVVDAACVAQMEVAVALLGGLVDIVTAGGFTMTAATALSSLNGILATSSDETVTVKFKGVSLDRASLTIGRVGKPYLSNVSDLSFKVESVTIDNNTDFTAMLEPLLPLIGANLGKLVSGGSTTGSLSTCDTMETCLEALGSQYFNTGSVSGSSENEDCLDEGGEFKANLASPRCQLLKTMSDAMTGAQSFTQWSGEGITFSVDEKSRTLSESEGLVSKVKFNFSPASVASCASAVVPPGTLGRDTGDFSTASANGHVSAFLSFNTLNDLLYSFAASGSLCMADYSVSYSDWKDLVVVDWRPSGRIAVAANTDSEKPGALKILASISASLRGHDARGRAIDAQVDADLTIYFHVKSEGGDLILGLDGVPDVKITELTGSVEGISSLSSNQAALQTVTLGVRDALKLAAAKLNSDLDGRMTLPAQGDLIGHQLKACLSGTEVVEDRALRLDINVTDREHCD